MPITAVRTSSAPPPAGPYSQAARQGAVLALAGQVGIDPATGTVAGPDIAAQTGQAIDNLVAVLSAADSDLGDVVMVRVYLTDVAHFADANAVLAARLTPPYPARTTVYVGLPPGLLIEIDALAVVPSARP